jgi:hypothetical protein
MRAREEGESAQLVRELLKCSGPCMLYFAHIYCIHACGRATVLSSIIDAVKLKLKTLVA